MQDCSTVAGSRLSPPVASTRVVSRDLAPDGRRDNCGTVIQVRGNELRRYDKDIRFDLKLTNQSARLDASGSRVTREFNSGNQVRCLRVSLIAIDSDRSLRIL